jgi:hypothetical protein
MRQTDIIEGLSYQDKNNSVRKVMRVFRGALDASHDIVNYWNPEIKKHGEYSRKSFSRWAKSRMITGK